MTPLPDSAEGYKSCQIAICNPHCGAKVMRDQVLIRDPSADSSWRDLKPIGHLGDREEREVRR